MAKNTMMWVVIAAVAVLVISAGGLNEAIDKYFGGDDADDAPAAPPTVVDQCESTTTPALNVRAYDIENPGTTIAEADLSIYRKAGTNTWTTFTTGTAIDNLEVGEQYEVALGISTTDQVDNSYGPVFTTDPIACKELSTEDIPMYVDEIETSITATFYNADGDATLETFLADQTQTVELKFETGSNEFCGNPYIETSGIPGPQRAMYPNVLCLELDSTDWDIPEGVSYQGATLNRVSQPLRQAGSATANTYCYEAPIVSDTMDKIRLRLNSDTNNAPDQNNTASFYCANFFVNADTGNIDWGVEDEDGGAAATDAADTVVMQFVA